MTVISNSICTVCGCCCDDIEVEIRENRIVKVKNSCAISLSKYQNYHNERITTPLVRDNGKLEEASFSEATERAAHILVDAKYPLLWGWSLTSCEAVEVGVELAEELGGVIDNNTSICHGPGLIGIHDIGASTCSLGQIKNRADLIIYWGSNPVHSHPRHLIRYSAMSKGRFRKSRADRKMVVFDVRRTDTAKLADKFVQIEVNADYELLTALRSAVKGEEIEQDKVSGVSVNDVDDLAEMMLSCSFGIIFYGVGLTMSAGKSRNLDAALSLVRDLNSRTKFVIMPMRGHFNVAGANEVITWLTGYPFAVDFSRGYPTYNPGDTTLVEVLSRNECDAVLSVSSDPIAHVPYSAGKYLMDIPLITLDPHKTATTEVSDVVIPTAMIGIESSGTVYRMDGVVLETKNLVQPTRGVKPDVEVLKALLNKVRKLKRG